MEFRRLKDHELEEAYSLHCRLVEQMLSKGIRQWLRPMAKKKFEERQERGENYGLFSEGIMKVLLSLVRRRDYHEWDDLFPDKETIWLNTVSVNPENKEKGLGKVAVEKAMEFLERQGEKNLYLDCVINDGFLVRYYKTLGFDLETEKRVTYRSGTFDMALMKKRLGTGRSETLQKTNG